MRCELLPLAGISHGRKTLPKLSLLPLSFPLAIQFPRLLLGTRSRACAAREKRDYGRREKQESHNFFHNEFYHSQANRSGNQLPGYFKDSELASITPVPYSCRFSVPVRTDSRSRTFSR